VNRKLFQKNLDRKLFQKKFDQKRKPFQKGLSENDANGMIKRHNACYSRLSLSLRVLFPKPYPA
jgi:hypothetical protein